MRTFSAQDVLFEDPHLVAIHKPQGIAFHNDAESEGIVQRVRALTGNEALNPVHRLDRVTSGLMLFARHGEALSELSRLFRDNQIEKYYLCLSARRPSKKQGSLIGDMAKSRNGTFKLLRTRDNPAITRLRSYNLQHEDSPAQAMTLLKPETGKTHQLRVAMKALASPILGDERYGGAPADRVYLHSWMKGFMLFGQRYWLTSAVYEGALFTPQLERELNKLNPELAAHSWPKGSFLLPRQ